MSDFKKNLSERETTEVKGVEEEYIEDEFEDPKSVKDKLAGAKNFLVQRGKEVFGWVSKRFGFTKAEGESMEKELEGVEKEADKALKKAGEEIELTDNSETLGSTKVERVKTEGENKPKEIKSEEIKSDDLVPEGQADSFERLFSYEKELEGSGFSEAEASREIYRKILDTLIERAGGTSLKGELPANQIENVKLQQESDQDALDKLNAQEELDNEDIKQIKRLEEEIQNLDSQLLKLENIREGGGHESTDKGKEDIRKSLALLCHEGVNTFRELSKLSQTLYVERNIAEIKLDPREAQKNEILQKDIDYYKKALEDGEIVSPIGNSRAYEGIIKTDKDRGSKIEVIDSEGKVVDTTVVEELPLLRDKYKAGRMRGLRLKLELTKEQREGIEYNLKEKEKLLAAKPAEGKEADILKRKIDNLTEIMEIVSEAQKKYKKLNKALGDQKNFTETAKKFKIGPSEMSKVLRLKKERKNAFLRKALQEQNGREESEIMKDFVGELVDEVRQAA